MEENCDAGDIDFCAVTFQAKNRQSPRVKDPCLDRAGESVLGYIPVLGVWTLKSELSMMENWFPPAFTSKER